MRIAHLLPLATLAFVALACTQPTTDEEAGSSENAITQGITEIAAPELGRCWLEPVEPGAAPAYKVYCAREPARSETGLRNGTFIVQQIVNEEMTLVGTMPPTEARYGGAPAIDVDLFPRVSLDISANPRFTNDVTFEGFEQNPGPSLRRRVDLGWPSEHLAKSALRFALPYNLWPIVIVNRSTDSKFTATARYSVDVVPYTTSAGSPLTVSVRADTSAGTRRIVVPKPTSGSFEMTLGHAAGAAKVTISAPGVYVLTDAGVTRASSAEIEAMP